MGSYLKVLEDENIHIILGLTDKEDKNGRPGILLYSVMSRLAGKHGRRRFTLHIVSLKPRPLYIEDLREMIQNNIAYTLLLRYHGFDLEKIGGLVDRLVRDNRIVYGVVEKDFAELSSLLKSKGVVVEEI